jgi:hypothetical protein
MRPEPRPRLNAAARLGPIMLKNYQWTGSDPPARVAIAQFRIIHARFDKRLTQAFPKENHGLNIRNTPPPIRMAMRSVAFAWKPNGELAMKTPSLWMIAAACFIAPASVAHARSAYDGSWDLAFVTQTGSCDPSYNFTVNVSDGVVTHPNLVRFKGYVAKSGSVRASVTVHEKFASGTGRLSGTSGGGRWSGHAGSARCTGYWTAQRN